MNFDFIEACKDGNIDIVKAHIQAANDLLKHAGFTSACFHGHLDIVAYFLTSHSIDIHADDDLGFRFACKAGQLDIVQYLTSSPEITDHANIRAQNDYGFRWACQGGHVDIVTHLAQLNDNIFTDNFHICMETLGEHHTLNILQTITHHSMDEVDIIF